MLRSYLLLFMFLSLCSIASIQYFYSNISIFYFVADKETKDAKLLLTINHPLDMSHKDTSSVLVSSSTPFSASSPVATVSQQQQQQLPQISREQNKRRKPYKIVFVGDSLTRYMYLTLTYYLKTYQWPDQGSKYIEKVKDLYSNNWNTWLDYTHQELTPQEYYCDCYRYWETAKVFKWYQHCENRYYYDDDSISTTKDSISYITKFGNYPFHGHYQNQQQVIIKTINQTLRQYDWVYPSWSDLVEKYISQWGMNDSSFTNQQQRSQNGQVVQEKPDYFVFNSGHWKSHGLGNKRTLLDLKAALDKVGIQGIYRTTTYRRDEQTLPLYDPTTSQKLSSQPPPREHPEHSIRRRHDLLVCHYFPCVNVSWTGLLVQPNDTFAFEDNKTLLNVSSSNVGVVLNTTNTNNKSNSGKKKKKAKKDDNYDYEKDPHYVDMVHFRASVNNRMTKQLLDFIDELEAWK